MLEDTVHAGAEATVTWLALKDPGLKELMDKMYGYAVFPAVGRASAVLGGAHGHGEVFEHGKPIGFATLNQLTLGVQVGGQTYSELVMFTTKDALEAFKKSKISFTASASAVIVKAGATGTSNPPTTIAKAYSRGGMLLEMSLGGQRITFKKHLGKDHKKGIAGLFKKAGGAAEHHDGEPRAEAQESDGGGAEELREAAPEEGGESMEAEGAARSDEEAEASGAEEGQELEAEGEGEGEEPEEGAQAAGGEEEEQRAAGAEEEEPVEEQGEEPEEQQASSEEPEEQPEEQRAESPEEEAPVEEPEPPPKPARAAPPMTQKQSGAKTRGTQPRRRA